MSEIIDLFFRITDFILLSAFFISYSCFLLFGGKWQIGNFASLKINGLLRNSKRRYKGE